MAGLLEAGVEAVEVEAFAQEVPNLVQFDKTLYGVLKKEATTMPVSFTTAAGGITRPSIRVAMRIQGGAGIQQGTGNADSLGQGTGSQWVGFAVAPVFYFNVCQISFLARIATEGRKRGLFNVQAQELKNTFNSATQGLEAMLQGDGSGALDQIPSTAIVSNSGGGSYIAGLNNAFQFTDQQTVQVFPSIGGSSRGSFVISYSDSVAQTIYCAAGLPSGTTTGDYLMVAGGSGAANNAILGLKAWDVNSNTGSIGGLTRSNYPGRLSTPTINLQGGAISTLTPFRAKAILQRALGKDNIAIKNAMWYCGPDQTMQMASLWLNVQIGIKGIGGAGSNIPDMTPGDWPMTWGGNKVVEGMNATPGRLEFIAPSTWYIGELLPLELYDFGGGMTVAPVPDIPASPSGTNTYLTASMFSYVTSLNLVNSNPRAALYVQNAAQAQI